MFVQLRCKQCRSFLSHSGFPARTYDDLSGIDRADSAFLCKKMDWRQEDGVYSQYDRSFLLCFSKRNG